MISRALSTMPQEALAGSVQRQAENSMKANCLQLLAVCLQRCYKKSRCSGDLRRHNTRYRQEEIHTCLHGSLRRVPYVDENMQQSQWRGLSVLAACSRERGGGEVLVRLSPRRAPKQAGEHKIWRQRSRETLSIQISTSKASKGVWLLRL